MAGDPFASLRRLSDEWWSVREANLEQGDPYDPADWADRLGSLAHLMSHGGTDDDDQQGVFR